MSRKCTCETDIQDQTNVRLMQSLLGGGMSAYCRKCNGLLKSGMNDAQEDTPNWIKERYKKFWDDFDPETF